MKKVLMFLSLLSCCSSVAFSAANYKGNYSIDSFNKAKKLLERHVVYDQRTTIYCGVKFDEHKNTILPSGFESPVHPKRAGKIEWEHVVPAENLGQTFSEWRSGHPDCVDSKGKSFKGRKCAEKVNKEFRYMQSDMYNLYPAVGSVNADRGNKNFEAMAKSVPSKFGVCEMKIMGNKAEPPARARGAVARTYKYMEYAYPRYQMSSAQRRLMDAWDKQYPVEQWECTRALRIERLQRNENPFVKEACVNKGMWR